MAVNGWSSFWCKGEPGINSPTGLVKPIHLNDVKRVLRYVNPNRALGAGRWHFRELNALPDQLLTRLADFYNTAALQLHNRDPYAQQKHNSQLATIQATNIHMLYIWQWIVNSEAYSTHLEARNEARREGVQNTERPIGSPSRARNSETSHNIVTLPPFIYCRNCGRWNTGWHQLLPLWERARWL